jgi:hypothetical protein
MGEVKKIFVAISLAALILPAVASADGVIFPPPDYWVQETDQKAVIFHEKNVETMVVSITFRGNAKNFSWIVPTPTRPDVSKSTDELFTALAKLTEPQYDYRVMPMYSGGAEALPADQGVTVVETKKVEYYDITVLEADNPDALTKWLTDNKYKFPEEAKYLLNDYIDNKWYFTAIKIDTGSLSAGVEAQLAEGHAVPLKFTFSSSKIVYPLKISGIAEYLKQPEPWPIPMVEEGTVSSGSAAIKIDEAPVTGNCSLATDCGGLFCPQVVGQDTPCCQDGQCVCGSSDCRFGDSGTIYPEPEIYPVPPRSYWQPNVSILLYVFSDHKQELPGFNTDYANWVKRGDVEKLAIESNGENWIKPKAGKSYLTKMSRYMQSSEMTYDLYPRAASDNDKVGVREADWQGGMLGVLIFFVVLSIILVVGFIAPPGLIFVGCTLLQFFTKSKAAHIVAWIFQSLAFLITAGAGIIWLAGWYHYGEANWYGMVPYNWASVYTKSIFAAGMVAWLLFIVAMVGIIVWQILRRRKK